MNFQEALGEIKAGKRVRRKSWKDGDLSVSRSGVVAGLKAGVPAYRSFFQLNVADGEIYDWAPSPEDISATDWEAV